MESSSGGGDNANQPTTSKTPPPMAGTSVGDPPETQNATPTPPPPPAPAVATPSGCRTPAKKTPKDFIFGKLLGEGSFSSVYLAKDVRKGDEYAIKVCDKQHIIRERKTESIKREKEVLAVLSANRNPTAPFFVHLYATFQDSQRLYFVVTYGHGGELLKYLHRCGGPLPLHCCKFYLAEILQALRHLHACGIVHRDLKPENILLTEHGHILITDFGSAKILTQSPSANSPQHAVVTSPPPQVAVAVSPAAQASAAAAAIVTAEGRTARSNSFVGTAQYVSPEVLKGRYPEVGPPADLWAFGCIVFQLVAGSLPFQAPNEFLIFQKILKLEYIIPSDFHSEAKSLVEQLLKLEPSERLGAGDAERYVSIQTHSFFEGVDWDTLHEQIPPMIPEGSSSSKRRRRQPSQEQNLEPGFDPRVMAERALRMEQLSLDCSDDEMTDDSSGGDEPQGEGGVSGENVVVAPTPPPQNSRGGAIALPQCTEERRRRLEEQCRNSPKHDQAARGNLILKQGLVNKRKGLFARRRLLLLTEGPHLFYCEPGSLNVKGEIPWGPELRPEAKDFKFFFVHTPNRTYNLEDPQGYALDWCRAINEMKQHVYGEQQQNNSNTSNQNVQQ